MRSYSFLVLLVIILPLVNGNSSCLNNQSNRYDNPDNFYCPSDSEGNFDVIELSTPEECLRPCYKNASPKICYFNFTLEFYPAMGDACNLCTPTTMQGLKNYPSCECILADGYERTVFSVNRMIPGPQVQVCKNDSIVIDVKNQADGSEVSLHWHGIFQRNHQYYDGVPYVTQCPIGSFSTFRYQFRVVQSGTFLWHSHVSVHRMDGQYGSFVIREPVEDDPHAGLYDVDDPAHVIIISDWMHELATDLYPGLSRRKVGQKPDNILINGIGKFQYDNGTVTSVKLATFNVELGKRYRFRLINAFTSTCLTQFTVKNHSMLLIAQDGANVEPVHVNTIVTGAGERVDFILNANVTVNTYWIHVKGIGVCLDKNIQQLAKLKYKGASQPSEDENPLNSNDTLCGIVYNPIDGICDPDLNSICPSNLKTANPFDTGILKNEPDERFVLSFGFHHWAATNTLTDLFSANQSNYPIFMVASSATILTSLIDEVSYIPASAPPLSEAEGTKNFCEGGNSTYCRNNKGPLPCSCTHIRHIPLNSLVEVVIYDEYSLDYLIHPFHLHGTNFYVFDMGTIEENRNITKEDIDVVISQHEQRLEENLYDKPSQKDTILVPLNGWVIFRYFAVNPGYWLFHCHFDWHSTSGMQMIFHVGNRSDLPPIPPSFPTCGSFQPPICIFE